jgi:hypothetical protein
MGDERVDKFDDPVDALESFSNLSHLEISVSSSLEKNFSLLVKSAARNWEVI